jgi:hypothetical protein
MCFGNMLSNNGITTKEEKYFIIIISPTKERSERMGGKRRKLNIYLYDLIN